MARQRSTKHKKLAAKPGKETKFAIEKAKVKAEKALIRTKAEERARPKSNETLTEAQKALRAAQVEIKRERQARIKAEAALTDAQENLAATRLEAAHERQARIKRVSFVVRLTVDKHGQLGRTEIEHVESSRKQNFLSLDGEHLVAFMKAFISPTIISEPAIPTVPSVEKLNAPMLGTLRPRSNLIMSEVQVFQLGDPDFMTLVLPREESFGLKARFQLQGPDAQFLTVDASSFEMKIYANEVASGKCKLLTTYSAKLIQNTLEYTVPMEVPGLSPGLYCLFTVITLHTPTKLARFYETIIFIV